MGDASKIVLDYLDFPPFQSIFRLLYCTEKAEMMRMRNKNKWMIQEHVRLNKDASKGRDEGKIAERDWPDFIADCLLQKVGRNIADFKQVIFRLFAGYFLFGSHGTVSDPYLGFFQPISLDIHVGRTDGPSYIEMRGRI